MPPRGSFEDRILVELIQRERWTKISELETNLMAHGMFAGGKGDEVYRAVKELTRELKSRMFHHGFSSRQLMEKLKRELGELRSSQGRLKSLDAMTV